MSHNIHTATSNSVEDGQTVLTVVDATIAASLQGSFTGKILFQHEVRDELPRMVVQGVDGNLVVVRGEDLYAFRELLNELPEEAFVRPADPVEEFYTLVDGDGDVWGFVNGEWHCGEQQIEDSFTSGGYVGFGAWEEIAAIHGIRAFDEPEWIKGDLVVYKGTNFTSAYLRDADGNWTRTSSTGSLSQKVRTDASIESMLSIPNYVAIRKNGEFVNG